MTLKVLFHDNCFDGAASAGLFARFFVEAIEPGAEVVFQGVQHKGGESFPPGAFDAGVNACVDFRYSRDPGLTWWFDHHASGFPTPEDRAHFEADAARGVRKFYDPAAKSNTRFMARTLAERHGWDIARFSELIEWAEIIDGALFPDANMPVALEEPALRIMTWIENNKDRAAHLRMIGDLTTRPLADIAADAYVAGPLAPLLAKHQGHIEAIRQRGVLDRGVVFFDLLGTGIEAHNKFIAYMLFPACRYTVGLTQGPTRTKISVGSNPWPPAPRTHDISRICERHGGGGHAVVGAISLPVGDIERARKIAREVVAELQQD